MLVSSYSVLLDGLEISPKVLHSKQWVKKYVIADYVMVSFQANVLWLKCHGSLLGDHHNVSAPAG